MYLCWRGIAWGKMTESTKTMPWNAENVTAWATDHRNWNGEKTTIHTVDNANTMVTQTDTFHDLDLSASLLSEVTSSPPLVPVPWTELSLSPPLPVVRAVNMSMDPSGGVITPVVRASLGSTGSMLSTKCFKSRAVVGTSFSGLNFLASALVIVVSHSTVWQFCVMAGEKLNQI